MTRTSLLAAGVVAVELGGAWAVSRVEGEASLTALGIVLLVVRGAVLAVGPRYPYAVGTVVLLATAGYGMAELPDPVLPLAPVVALGIVVLQAPRALGLAITVAVVAGAVSVTLAAGDSDAADYYLVVFGPALAWAVAEIERNRRARVSEEAARAAAEERTRIARELHDVVAHHVSMMVVQAEAGASVAEGRDRDAFDGIAGSGRTAMAELRRLLSAWRDAGSAASTEPQPGLERIDDLVATVRRAGLPVDLTVEGERRPLPPGVDVSAYRIVQEALTNVLKHAGPARAAVLVRYGEGALEVSVTDDGRGAAADNGGGHGLAGIRERVALFGGVVRTGPRSGGGYEVAATLPTDT